MLKNITIISLSLLLFSCSSLDRLSKEEQDSKSYSNAERGKFSNVTEGVVVSIKQIKISGSKGLGATFGTVLGGVVGSSTTDKKYNKEAAIAVGALAGAILGSTVEKFTTEDTGYEFLIRTSSGVKAFVDTVKQDLRVGDEVYIIHGSGPVRISKK